MKASDLTSEERRDAIIAAADDKKANYVTVIDMRGKTLIADFFVICSGTSNIHIRSIADGIIESLKQQGVKERRMEGYSEATWVLLDYGDVIVHVMSEEQRDYYKLETLWTGKPESAPAPGANPDGLDEVEEEELDFEGLEDDLDTDYREEGEEYQIDPKKYQ